jgi:signal transduction histidine kinase/CheY-like chemotaxis protein
MDDFIAAGRDLDVAIQNNDTEAINATLENIDQLNDKFTNLEVQFSNVLGEGSRWLENLLMIIMIMAVLTVESCGLGLTVSFTRNLSKNLRELSTAAEEVGRGNFSHLAPVHARDELGQLAEAINKMTVDLKKSIGQRDEAEHASKVKSLFLANMSHEIRTPLGVIIGLTEILKDPQVGWEDRQRYIDTIERTGKNLNRIINDILDISKVEAGHLEIEKTQFTLDEFMSDLQSLLQIQAEKNSNDIVFTPLGVLPRYIVTDRTRLRQILVNVVNNALKFTKNGKITIYYTADEQYLFFDITDTGIGISSEFKKDLFKNFSQADGSTTRVHEGTGLGLALSKRLSQALGGDVVLLRSEIGVGSTFRVSIANDQRDVRTHAHDAPDRKVDLTGMGVKGKRILIVEDVKENQLILQMYLSRYGMIPDFADNGKIALDKVQHGSYDVILMDMQMPVMDGYTATKALRDRGYDKPIVALTAHAMKEDRDRCLQAGCDEYLTKPIEAATLYATLSKFFIKDSVQFKKPAP